MPVLVISLSGFEHPSTYATRFYMTPYVALHINRAVGQKAFQTGGLDERLQAFTTTVRHTSHGTL
jgi:hypothetical protein